jgi:hypothetical protein
MISKVVSVSLNAGTNTIELGNNAGKAEIDGLMVPRQEAEWYGILSGGATAVARSNAQLGGDVGTMTSSTSCIDLSQKVLNPWTFSLAFMLSVRYSAPASAGVTVYVNGGAGQSLSLPSTGGTNTFSTATLGITLANYGWNSLKICQASGAPEVDSFAWSF